MCEKTLDLEDVNFLKDLIEELPKIDSGVYITEANELKDILLKLIKVPIFTKVKFECSECGDEAWFEVNLKTYVVSTIDLVCDDCNLEDD